MDTSQYASPLIERYASREMSYFFSHDFKFGTWRKIWIALAEAEQELGLPITDAQITEMKEQAGTIDFARAAEWEKKTRHDVMSHVHTYGEACPTARPIIHLGATSAFVGDNTDIIQIKEATRLIIQRLTMLIDALSEFAREYKNLPTLGFTHYQPAQCTTVGKRATLWILDLSMDLEDLIRFYETLPFRGAKGTTGTQASFLNLFNGDHAKVKQLDDMITQKMGFSRKLPVSGQTYTRKIDAQISALLSGVAQSIHKMANDIRLLANRKEIEEPFAKNQIGSSAMAYKRNPMRSERMTALARFIISLASSPAMTAAEQWFERTLDDSANKRLAIAEAFLATDAILTIGLNVSKGLVVYPKVIEKNLREELPFMATENIIMEAVKKGGDRQELHEQIRVHSMEAGKRVKLEGEENDLLARIVADPLFKMNDTDMARILNLKDFIGRAPEQTDEFLSEYLAPILSHGKKFGNIDEVELSV
ncbi:adenylosuccinate lyase [Chitinivibrio alkaliphilus]|uniref:Adenylosuccinate lyase n=1 Tax=Chitinivibrio alkaliphilus ACht1 TaxID=1313304 RepID=U7D819_9BACT|nr:adenylosuccinate lyase [Chitinivibrio alkaliphilus]ERP39100.1 adenylosuccinate lyase [Chitinivibrio alkaliphilus ACht1]